MACPSVVASAASSQEAAYQTELGLVEGLTALQAWASFREVAACTHQSVEVALLAASEA